MTKPTSSPAGETLAGLVSGMAEATRDTFHRPLVPPGLPPRRLWTWAILLALTWHLLWFVWLRAGHGPYFHPAPAPVRLTYAPAVPAVQPGADAESGMRGVWSPLLFSLPTEHGFSRPALRRGLALAPPLETPGEAALYLERDPSDSLAPTAGDVDWSDQLAVASRERTDGPQRADEFDRVVVGLPPGALQIDVLDGLQGMSSRSVPIPAAGRLPADKPWEAVAWVRMNEEGRVGHVFLEQPSPSRRGNSLLVRALYQILGHPTLAGTEGRLRIRYPGENEPTAEAGTP